MPMGFLIQGSAPEVDRLKRLAEVSQRDNETLDQLAARYSFPEAADILESVSEALEQEVEIMRQWNAETGNRLVASARRTEENSELARQLEGQG